MKLKHFFTFFLLLILPSLSYGANYYVDCSAGKNGNGSYTNPWNNLNSLNSKTFSNGDGLYFKVNTTCYLNSNNDRVQVKWSGTGGNKRAIIGAYYGNGLFGLNGKNRPVIDGRNRYPGKMQGAIDIINKSYITVRDLKIQNAGGLADNSKAVRVISSKNINVENTHLYRPHGGCVLYQKVNTGIISDNSCDQAGYPDFKIRPGAAIEVTAGNVSGATTNILVTRNKVSNSIHEGIGFYKKVTNSIAQYNVVRDIRSFFIYIDASKNVTVRHNLVYESTQNVHSSFTRVRSSFGIAADNENGRGYSFMGNHKIYGNLIGGVRRGISLFCGIRKSIPAAVCYPDTKVYNNTIVDTDLNLDFNNTLPKDAIEVKNNISLIVTEGKGYHHLPRVQFNAPGITWSKNLFHGGPNLTGKVATNMIKVNPMLKKNSGWRSLSPGSVKGDEFLPNNSQVMGAGVLIPSNLVSPASSINVSSGLLVKAANFTASPIKVSTSSTSGSVPVGAWMRQGNDSVVSTDSVVSIDPPQIKSIEGVK
jgi:hypothetical protein